MLILLIYLVINVSGNIDDRSFEIISLFAASHDAGEVGVAREVDDAAVVELAF